MHTHAPNKLIINIVFFSISFSLFWSAFSTLNSNNNNKDFIYIVLSSIEYCYSYSVCYVNAPYCVICVCSFFSLATVVAFLMHISLCNSSSDFSLIFLKFYFSSFTYLRLHNNTEIKIKIININMWLLAYIVYNTYELKRKKSEMITALVRSNHLPTNN